MPTLTKEAILDTLKLIRDGETQPDVVTKGLIQGLVIRDGNVGFSIEVDPKEGAAKEPLRKACEAAVLKMPGVVSVTAVLTAHSDAPPAASREPAPTPSSGIDNIGSIIAVASGKGGVGKSTVAVNLALALSKLGKRVGILDADIYGPSLPRMMGLTGKPDTDGKKLIPKENYGLKCMSIGFLVDEDTPMIWRGPMVVSALTQMLNDTNWGELDVLVVDMPPGTGDAQLTMAQRVPLAGAIIVSTPQEIALIDARKGLAMFNKTEVPLFGIIENMSYFISPESGERSYIFGEGGARRTAETLGTEFLGEIPLHMSIREHSDDGTPIVASEPESESAGIFQEIAERVANRLDSANQRQAPTIVIE